MSSPHRQQLALAPDEAGELIGKVSRASIERAKDGKFGGEPVDVKLVDPDRFGQILEAVLAQVAHTDPFGEVPSHESPGRVGHEHLAAVPRPGDTSGAMDIQPDIVVSAQTPLAAVQAHADSDGRALRPSGVGQPALRLHRSGDGSERRRKDGEESVSLGVDLRSGVSADGGPQDVSMHGKQRRIRIAECGKKPSRALDVGEQERHRTGRQTDTQQQMTSNSGWTMPPGSGRCDPRPHGDRRARADDRLRLGDAAQPEAACRRGPSPVRPCSLDRPSRRRTARDCWT